MNENGIDLLRENQDKIDWEILSENTAIFEYDYCSMTQRCNLYKEELIANRLHPNNFNKFNDWGFLE